MSWPSAGRRSCASWRRHCPDDLLLVIDGLEHVGDDEAASHLLRVLSLEAPAQLHLVLSGRSLPDLGLGVAQGRGELLEVTAPDLSFTTAETGAAGRRCGSARPACR